MRRSRRVLYKNVDLTVTGDTVIAVPRWFDNFKYQVISVNAFLGRAIGVGITPTLGLFSAAGGGGTTLVATALLNVNLSGADMIFALTLTAAASAETLSSPSLFARVGVAGLNSIDLEILISEVGP
jgi:hypothetical protein